MKVRGGFNCEKGGVVSRPAFGEASGMGEQDSWPRTLDDLSRLVDAFQHRMVRYAFRRLGNLHEAEDVAQEVFVRFYADSLRRGEVIHVSAYLYRIASNLCSDMHRRRRYPRISLDQAEAPDPVGSHPDSTQAIMAAEELHRIDALLSRLPERQAEVIRLRVFDELRLREIAEVLGCPLATVKTRLRYGLAKLRRFIPHKLEHRNELPTLP